MANAKTEPSDSMDLSYAEGWRPEPGSVLIGTVTDVGKGWSDQGNQFYPIVTIQPEAEGSEPVAVHCFHTTLFGRMTDLRPGIGERIGIKYLGKEPLKSNPDREVAKYVVKMDRAPADLWDSLGDKDSPKESEPTGTDDDIPF